MSHPSLLESMLIGKCPQCRQDKLFIYPLFHPKFMNMRTECRCCGLHYEREPGFFYGAMYVSYALNVAIFLAVGFFLYFFFGDPSLTTYIVTVVVASILLYPLVFRWSRSIFLHAFSGMNYRPEKADNKGA